jgi:hypothetical protein
MEIIEKPLGGGRDEHAIPHVAGKRAVGGIKYARVVAQARKDAAGMPPLRAEGVMRCEGERPLIEPLGAQRFVTKGLFAVEVSLRRSLK